MKYDLYDETLVSPPPNEWITSIRGILDSIAANYDLVDLQSDYEPIGNKWMLNVKFKAGGPMHNFKALVLAKCYIREMNSL